MNRLHSYKTMNPIAKDAGRLHYEDKVFLRILFSRNRVMKVQLFVRLVDTINNVFLKKIGYYFAARIWEKNGIEIASLKNVGGGILFVHPYNIAINAGAKIGEDFTIFKGATIGSIRSGKKAGAPRIGDRVTVGANAFVCGKCHIGNDVMIAANSFVNFDVPSNSVVIGSPGIIHSKESPSADYL